MTAPVLIVLNPAAGAGAAGREWPNVADRLRAVGLHFDVAMTSATGDAQRISREAVLANRPVVAAMGGDGTLNEVADGFFDDGLPVPTTSSLGLLPFGTGGDTKRTLGIPKEIEAAAAVLAGGRPRLLDAGVVRCAALDGGDVVRHFVNIAEAGLGAAVSDRVNRMPKTFGGRVSFMLGTLAVLATWRHRPMTVSIDGGEPTSLVAQGVVVANCQFYGGGMRVAPRADPADGLFDVLVVGDLGKVEGLRGLAMIYRGAHLDEPMNPKLTYRRARQVLVTSPERVLVQVEGEAIGCLPARFDIVPAAIRFMVPV